MADAITGDANAALLGILVVAYCVVGAAAGFAGDMLLYRRAVAVTGRLRLKGTEPRAVVGCCAQAGGVSITGVVLAPVALVVIALLAIVALPDRLLHQHEVASIAAMKSDLRNLVTVQESYFADSSTYLAGALLNDSTIVSDSSWAPRFTPSGGVTISIGIATATGWNATARHAGCAEQFVGAKGRRAGGTRAGWNQGHGGVVRRETPCVVAVEPSGRGGEAHLRHGGCFLTAR